VTASASGLATFDDLVQRCQDWLFGRADIAAQVPTFIRLFEAKANRKLMCRQMEIRAIASVDITSVEPEFLELPADFQTMRRVRLVKSASDKPKLKFATGQQIDDLRENNKDNNGQPVWFSLFSDQMELCPTPTANYQVEMVYRRYLLALSSNNETNWLLDLAPDAYLYGTLMEAAPYLMDDDRIPTWASGVQSAFQDLSDLSQQALYNAGPLVMRRTSSRGYS
jgi:hypothetical protein